MEERYKLYNGDCLEVLKNIESESIDLCIIDPPYRLTSGGVKGTEIRGSIGRKKNENMSSGKVFKHNSIKSEEWFKEIYRVMKDETHLYVMCNDKYVQEYLNNAEKAGFKEVNILVWSKGMHTPTQYYMKNIEFILLFRKGRAKYINNMGSFALIDIKGIRGNKVHPSEKPYNLMQHLVLNSSNENDLVLDCFMGSGSTGVACINTNRRFIGIELDENYFNISKKRIEESLDKEVV